MIRFHIPEFEAAWEATPDPVTMCERHGLCETALEWAVNAMIEQQMAELARGPQLARDELAEAGIDTSHLDDETIVSLTVRAMIGGAFSFGVGLAMELQAAEVRERAR